MTSTPIVIIGAGGFGREVLDVIDAINDRAAMAGGSGGYEFLGFLDDGEPNAALLEARGVSHLGPIDHLDALADDVGYVIGIGNGSVRRSVDTFAGRHGRTSPVLVHPSSTQGFDVQLGPGTIVCSQVALTNNIRVGRHVHLNLTTTVGHDVVLGDYVTVSPQVAISGEVTVEDEVLLGTGAAINQGLVIGRGATLGSGAAAVKDIPPEVVAVGIPARPR